MKRLWHIPWLAGSLVTSLLILRLLDPFAGQGTGVLILFLLGSLACSHLLAAVTACFLLKRSWQTIIVIMCIAMLPTFLYSLVEARDAWYLRHQAVYDRFRDNLSDPIPDSVSNLEFVPLEESHETHLTFRFSISPDDLSKIIQEKGFRQISTSDFRRTNDLFTHKEYLFLPEPVSFYIHSDIDAGYPDIGVGEGYTLKVSGDGKQVVFRRESAAYYRYRYWESDFNHTSETEFLEALKTEMANM